MLIYRHGGLYQLVMRALYGCYFEARYQAVADEIPVGASVTDVCAGDCYLYRKYLGPRGNEYLGLDLSVSMVHWACKHNIPARVFDLRTEEIPPADVVVMQGSLYQFMPDQDVVMHKLLGAARQKVIVAESVYNLSDSSVPVLSWLSRYLTRLPTDDGSYGVRRFNSATLHDFFRSFALFERCFPIPGDREMVGIFRGARTE